MGGVVRTGLWMVIGWAGLANGRRIFGQGEISRQWGGKLWIVFEVACTPGYLPTGGRFLLSEYSPAIGQASPTDAPSIDLYGLPRPSPANSNPDQCTRKSLLIPLRTTSNGGGSCGQSSLENAQKSTEKWKQADPDEVSGILMKLTEEQFLSNQDRTASPIYQPSGR